MTPALAGLRYTYPMSTVSVPAPDDVILTARAAAKVRELAGGPAILRLGVQGGGCGGFQYLLALDEGAGEDGDTHFATPLEDVSLVIDQWSLPYLGGSSVDFLDGLQESGFKVSNPRATDHCGCGQSFRVDEDGCPSSVDEVYA